MSFSTPSSFHDPFLSSKDGLKSALPRPAPRKTAAALVTVARGLFVAYLSIAVIYTFWQTTAHPLLGGGPTSANSSVLKATDPQQSRSSSHTMSSLIATSQLGTASDKELPINTGSNATAAEMTRKPVLWTDYGRIRGVEWDKDVITWHPVTEEDKEGKDMSEDFFLSKAFGESLQPSKVIPYYYRASTDFEKKDITITTLVTSNRFKILAALVERYQGPISVTIHVPSEPSSRTKLLDSLHELYTSSSFMSVYVDVHLVIDNFDRQFNMWRNVAKFFSRTDYIMMLDVDFAICTDFRQRILQSAEVMAKLDTGDAAFVVPAFEFVKQEDGLDTSTFPTNKQQLLKLVEEEKIAMFHASWKPGHGATNYTRYYQANPNEVYKVNAYTSAYEPYVIFKKEGTPYCDERFIGYGANKAACLYELYLSGVSYYILPDDFLIHQSHAYAEATRKNERKYNRKLYIDFREELCFRYLNQFVQNGKLETKVSRNLITECKKIKGFASAAGRFIAASTGKQYLISSP